MKKLALLLATVLITGLVAGFAAPSALAETNEGDILWQKNNIGDSLESAPAVDDEGNVYVVCGSKLYSYTSGGTQRWTASISYNDGITPAVSPDGEYVYVPGANGLYKLRTSNGGRVWISSAGNFFSVPCISADGSRIYIGAGHEESDDNRFYAINASDGSTAWTYTETSPPLQEIRGWMGGAVVDTDGTIFAPSQHGYLVSLTDNGSSYTLNWKFNLQAEARQPVTLTNGSYLFATCNTGYVHKIDKSTGVEVTSGYWPALGDVGEVFASMCISPDGNTLYVNSEDYKLRAISTSDGSTKWSYTFQVWGSDPLVRDDGKIIVMGQVSGAGRVCCLSDNGTSASLEWTSPRIIANLQLNETNVNIAPDGTIYVHSGDQSPRGLFAIAGNGQDISKTSPWPKYMRNIQNNGVSTVYQAEAYSLQSGCTVQNTNSGYTGTGYLDYGGNGTWGQWDIDIPSNGTYTLRFRYAANSDCQCELKVNGISAGNLAFANSGGLTRWIEQTADIYLNIGSNTVRVTANTSSGGPNLDKIEVQ